MNIIMPLEENDISVMHNPLHPGEIVREALFNDTGLISVGHVAKILK